MSPDEPRIALAASPREWAQRLHRHVADHGGALVRATVLHPADVLAEDVDVFVVDDTTSFLSPRLVDELHARGRHVLGVFDPDDPRGKGELVDCGVDDVIERTAPPEAFVAALRALTARGRAHPVEAPGVHAPERDRRGAAVATTPRAPAPVQRRGLVTVVAGVAGGAGATEIALGLAAAAARRGDAAVLVDADDVAPSLAQRLGVRLYPNIRAALEAMQHRSGTLDDVLAAVPAARFALLPGLASGRSWGDLRPGEVADLLQALATVRHHVVCNVGSRIEQLPAGAGGPPRYGLARHLLATADRVVAVAAPTPIGLARLLEWLADAAGLLGATTPHIVVNRAPSERFRRGEILAELGRAAPAAPVWLVPHDARVSDAVWRGGLVPAGPFARAVHALADAVLPRGETTRRRRWRR